MIDDQIFKCKNLHDFNTRQTLLCLTNSQWGITTNNSFYRLPTYTIKIIILHDYSYSLPETLLFTKQYHTIKMYKYLKSLDNNIQ